MMIRKTSRSPLLTPLRRLAIVGLLWLVGLTVAVSPPASAHDDLTTLDLAAYRGQVVYLDFWASWCGPCKQSFPFLDALEKKHGPAGFVVIAVNVDTDRRLAARFLNENPVGFKIVYDPKGELAERFNVSGMPMSFLIGRDGKTQFEHLGFRKSDPAKLESTLLKMLAEKAP